MTQFIELFSNSSEYTIGQHNNLKELTVRGEVDISGNITIDKDIKSTGDISCNTITATTLYGDGSNLTGISSGSTNLNAYSDVSFGNVDISNKLTVINSNAYYQQIGSDIDGEASNDNSSIYTSLSLSSDGSIVAIGAPYNNGGGTDTGHVRVYQNINSVWTQLGGDIDGDTNYEYFGISVSLSSDGTRVAIGATRYDIITVSSTDPNYKKGRVKIYEYDIGTNSWIQLGSDIHGEARNDGSAGSISLSSDGSIVAIGASGNDDNGTDAGHVRIYQYANNSWTQLGSDIDGEGNGQRAYVVSLSSDGSIVAIGAHRNNENGTWSGNVRVFKYLNNSWTQIGSDIYGESAQDQSGDLGTVSLSSDGTIVAIGAVNNSDNGSYSGHVRVYQYNSNTNLWSQLGSDIDGEAANDYSGKVSLSSDGTTLAIGAHNASDENSNNTGRVKVYRYTNNSWTQLGSNIYGEAQGDQFGYSLSISSDGAKLAVGAWGNDAGGNNSGHVRVYELIQNNVDINNGIISTNKLLLNYSNTSGSGTYDSVGIDYVQDGTRYIRFTDNTTNSESNGASADIRARNIWLDGSQLNVNNIKPVSGGKVILSNGFLELSNGYGILMPSSGDLLSFGVGGIKKIFYSDSVNGGNGTVVDAFSPFAAYNGAIDLGRSNSKWRRVYATNGSIQTSDDRLKINETIIQNSLEFIRTIDFYEYDKVKTLDGNDIQCKERGVIAQHLLNTDLEYILQGGKEEDLQDEESGVITRKYIPYGISYNDIFVTNCKATKELDILVQNQQNEINDLKAENTLIKSKLNELLIAAGKQTI